MTGMNDFIKRALDERNSLVPKMDISDIDLGNTPDWNNYDFRGVGDFKKA